MKKSKIAKSAKEFDKHFDQGEDIHDLLDIEKSIVTRPGRKIRITLDVSEKLVKEIDQIRETIGVDRAALIKIWLHERVKEETSSYRE
jgi:hypothetical protein